MTGKIITGETAVIMALVEIVEELYARTYLMVGENNRITEKLKMCREILGMEGEI